MPSSHAPPHPGPLRALACVYPVSCSQRPSVVVQVGQPSGTRWELRASRQEEALGREKSRLIPGCPEEESRSGDSEDRD